MLKPTWDKLANANFKFKDPGGSRAATFQLFMGLSSTWGTILGSPIFGTPPPYRMHASRHRSACRGEGQEEVHLNRKRGLLWQGSYSNDIWACMNMSCEPSDAV